MGGKRRSQKYWVVAPAGGPLILPRKRPNGTRCDVGKCVKYAWTHRGWVRRSWGVAQLAVRRW